MSRLKFKIGDRIEIVNMLGSARFDTKFRIGHRGKIVNIMRHEEYIYQVKRYGGLVELFKAGELRLIK